MHPGSTADLVGLAREPLLEALKRHGLRQAWEDRLPHPRPCRAALGPS
jgi:hypothetical protein